MCTVQPQDATEIARNKLRLGQLFQEGLPIEEVLSKAFQERMDVLSMSGLHGQVESGNIGDPTHPAGFTLRLQEAKTMEERAALYIAYYCTLNPDDRPQQRSLKIKYARHFESGMSHDRVLGMWKAEARGVQTRDLEATEKELEGIKKAQTGHLKDKKRKMMKEDAKMKGRMLVVDCSLPGCDKQMDKRKDRVVECVVCDWLARRSDQRRHSYYCSQKHNDEDFVSWRNSPLYF